MPCISLSRSILVAVARMLPSRVLAGLALSLFPGGGGSAGGCASLPCGAGLGASGGERINHHVNTPPPASSNRIAAAADTISTGKLPFFFFFFFFLAGR